MGNPHVIFVCEGDLKAISLREIGPLIESDPWFPNRINVHFVKFIKKDGHELANRCEMRTWERGSGETLACGTGACSVLVAGVLLGLCEATLQAQLTGGVLHLEWREKKSVIMTGPATEVFSGSLDLDKLYASARHLI